ncbi:MAG: biofilm formation protein PslH [Planctomycetota bacterium]|nr:MAG: biofilm formation protein PslH [Planctomycetota bacterium]
MQVLFVAHRAPFPPDKGDRLRAWRHLTRLSELGPVDIVAQADDEASARVAREGLAKICREVHVHTRRRLPALGQVGWALVSGASLTVAWLRDARVERSLRELGARHDYDLGWAFSSGTGPWIERARVPRRIMDLCDLDALKWSALAHDQAGPRGWVYGLEARRLLPLELGLSERCELSLLSTQQEVSDLCERTTPRRIEVLTNGVPWEQSSELPAPSEAPPVIGFLGQMDYPPNVAAARELALQVLPRVRERVPDAQLAILGRQPTAELRALASPGVIDVTGEVDSVPAALGGLRAFCAPLDRGRGIPNKILESMAAGRPTLVSSWSAKALQGVPGRDYLVADGAEGRAELLAELLADPTRCDELGAAGRAYVRTHHDWNVVLDRVQHLVEEVTSGA